ncbi:MULTISPECIES: hypothetical protein [Alkalimonas]|uniref:Uncharacterized protein n=1 Tax=Alkalimonas mucilaginosa TaxID=3057676 RepID=A0ABU7JMD3_9GAMM|nr:hypothetical protein [Alkalimonas sp. MEB004]MEE2026123.1 hypothetical protein [Alkalimonas sp. MEB004]
MKKAIFAVLFCYAATATASLEPIYMNRLTFSQLQMSAETLDNINVDMIGVLSLNSDGRVYLCESLDACLSWSPTKLEVDIAALKRYEQYEQYDTDWYSIFDLCHVQVSGEYVRDAAEDYGNRLGLLTGNNIRIMLSVSRVDYADFNPHCRAWNLAVETSKKNGNEAFLLERVKRMKFQTH